MNRIFVLAAGTLAAALCLGQTALGQGMDRPLVSRHRTAAQRLGDQYGTSVQMLADQGPTGSPMMVHRMYTATGRLVHEFKRARMTLVHQKRVGFQQIQAAETSTLVFVSRRRFAEPLVHEMPTARLTLVHQFPTIDP